MTAHPVYETTGPSGVTAIEAAAELARALLSGGPLPRSGELASMSADLRSNLETLINDLTARCPEEQREATAPAMLEGRYWRDMPLGAGMQSATSCTRNLADITLVLCGHHRRVIGG